MRQIAQDVGISEGCLLGWTKNADVEDGIRLGPSGEEPAKVRQENKRNSVVGQWAEVMRRAAERAGATVG